jgi:hypothetical protein
MKRLTAFLILGAILLVLQDPKDPPAPKVLPGLRDLRDRTGFISL